MDTSVNFQVDTRERGVNIQLSRTEFTYLDTSASLDISFNVEKTINNITDYISLYKNTPDNSFNFTITPNIGFDLSLNNEKRWTGTIQIDDNDYYTEGATLMFSYDTGFEIISDTDYEDLIKIKTEILVVVCEIFHTLQQEFLVERLYEFVLIRRNNCLRQQTPDVQQVLFSCQLDRKIKQFLQLT